MQTTVPKYRVILSYLRERFSFSLGLDLSPEKEEVLQEFRSGKLKETWELIPKNEILKVWKDFMLTGDVSDADIFEIYQITLSNIKKMLVNYETYIDLGDEEKDKFNDFAADDRGIGKWTENKNDLIGFLNKLKRAYTPKDKLLAVDNVLNYVHVSGPFADLFVEGGTSTLDLLRDSNVSSMMR